MITLSKTYFWVGGLCTAGEKVAGSSESLIPSLNAFSGKTLFNSSHMLSDSFVRVLQ